MGVTKRICIVAPCYDEAAVLPAFVARVRAVAASLPAYAVQLLLVDDGSRDATPGLLRAWAADEPWIGALRLARNYGHQRAISAGLDFADADFVFVMDADLQDPPEAVPAMLALLESGFDVVHTVRADRSSDAWSKRTAAALFYAVMRRWVLPELPENAGDFKGFSRRVLLALRLYRERVRFLRGLFATLGYRQTTHPIVRAPRGAGTSKYPWRSVLRLARDAIVSNSALPMRAGVYLGLVLLAAAPPYALAALRCDFGAPLLRAAVGLQLLIGGATLVFLGLTGEYLRTVLLEVKQRPLYIVESAINVTRP